MEDKGRDAFPFYRSYRIALKCLDDEQRLAAYDAISDYALFGVEPELNGVAEAIFALVKPTIDKGQNLSNNRKGKKKKTDKEQNKNKSKTDSKQKQSESESEEEQTRKDVDIDGDYDGDGDKDLDYDSNPPIIPPSGEDAPISDPAEEVALGKTAYTVADVVSLYNSICLSLPRVKTISDARRRQVGARMKMYSYEDFKTLFTKAEASPFLKGANDHNWSADFDWLTKDRNMAKVIDGNYDGLDTRSKNKAAQSPQSVITRLQEWAEKGGS